MPQESHKQLLIESIVCLKDMLNAYQEEQINKIRYSDRQEYDGEEHPISLPDGERYEDTTGE